MRDYVLTGTRRSGIVISKPVAEWPTGLLTRALEEIRRDGAKEGAQCTAEQMIARIEIELTARRIGA